MTADKEPRAVIFDMDGVLVDSAAAHYESWRQLATETGASVTEEQFARTFGRQNRDIIPILFGGEAASDWVRLSDRKEEIYRDLVRGRCPVVEGAVDLVRDLHERRVRLAVGSSGPLANIELVLMEMKVRTCFEAVVSADDVTRGKPDPQVFQLASDRLGVAPRNCVVIEDSPSGVQAARAAGVRVVAIMMHHSREALEPADLIIECLADVTCNDLLALMNGADDQS